MMLAIDIGNTTISCGLFRGGRLAQRFDVPTAPAARAGTLKPRLEPRLRARLPGARIEQTVLCSVVPRMSSVLVQALTSFKISPIRVVGHDLTVPLKNRYKYPGQVGQDRLVGAYAAWQEFGRGGGEGGVGRGRDCIVADFGTAITIDVVTKDGSYLGGIIAPGLEISLEALAARTALLPKVKLEEPPELLGRDTANSIRAGVLFGCAALCDGLVARLKRQYASNALVVGTGGASRLVCKHTRQIDRLRPNLVLEGLYQLSLHPELYT